MSYNIDRIEIVSSRGFQIDARKLKEIGGRFDNIPGDNPFRKSRTVLVSSAPCEDCDGEGAVVVVSPKSQSRFSVTCPSCDGAKESRVVTFLKCFPWTGEFSGNSFKTLKTVLMEFEGEADFVLTWESGDHFSGLRLRDGAVTEHEVVMSLGKEKDEP